MPRENEKFYMKSVLASLTRGEMSEKGAKTKIYTQK
jgi:hypothetical protein